MAFKWDNKDDRTNGTGTLKEYFSSDTWAADPEPKALVDSLLGEGASKELEDRDNAIDRLQLELFTAKCGLPEDTFVRVVWPESGYYDEETVRKDWKRYRDMRRRTKGFLLLGWQMDDPIMALYYNGVPIAAFYASYRGVYQAGGFVASRRDEVGEWDDVEEYYFAHNFLGDEPKDTWIEDGKDGRTCAHVAKALLMGERTY